MTAWISAQNLQLTLGGKRILNSIDIDFAAGKVHCVLGPNGCGKTTLIRVLSGALRPDAGQVLLDDRPISTLSPAVIARTIAVVWQGSQVGDDVTVRRLISYGRYARLPWWWLNPSGREAAIEQAMAVTQVMHLANRRVNSLSGGERQRVWIAVALAQEPKVLLLDEPTTYLDIAHQLDVLELVRNLNRRSGLTVIAVLHDLAQAARYGDRCLVMKDGSINADGIPAEALSAEEIARSFAVNAWVARDPETGHPVIVPRHRILSDSPVHDSPKTKGHRESCSHHPLP